MAPKQAAGEDGKEMEMYKQYVYNPQPFLTVYFDQKHPPQLQFLQRNNEPRNRVRKCEARKGFGFGFSFSYS